MSPVAEGSFVSNDTRLPAPQYVMMGAPVLFDTPQGQWRIGSFFDVFPELQLVAAPPDPIHDFSGVPTEMIMAPGVANASPFQAPAQMQIHFAPPNVVSDVYDMRILQMTISGGDLPAGVVIQESPILISEGQHTYTDLGGGLFQIDSFFDVFLELSLDNGNTWTAAGRSMRIVGVPERGTLALLGLGSIGLLSRRRARSIISL